MVSSFRELIVWQRAMDLAVQVYRVAGTLPHHEIYGLASQLRRAAASVPANIAEGNGRTHRAEYLRYLSIARGSLNELETHVLIAQSLDYLQQDSCEQCKRSIEEVSRLLTALARKLAPRP